MECIKNPRIGSRNQSSNRFANSSGENLELEANPQETRKEVKGKERKNGKKRKETGVEKVEPKWRENLCVGS